MSIDQLVNLPARNQAAATFVTNANAIWPQLNTYATQANALAAAMTAIAAGTALNIPYTFSTTTADSDPGAGILRLGSATQNAATVIRADLLSSDTTDRTTILDTFDDSSNTVKGQLTLVKVSDPTKWLAFNVTAVASPSGYRNITVANIGSSAASPFSNADSIILLFTRAGDVGATGASGANATLPIAAASGTVDAITATFSPALTLADKTLCWVVCAGANTITTPTFAPDGLTAHTIKTRGGTALLVGDIPAANFTAMLEYNLSGTYWELLNPGSSPGIGTHEVIVTTGNGYGSTNTKIRRFTTTQTNVGTAITYADSATLGATFTINQSGLYAIRYSEVSDGTANVNFGATLNSAQLTTAIQSVTASTRVLWNIIATAGSFCVDSTVVRCAVGDVLRAHSGLNCGDTSGQTVFSVKKIGL